MKRKLLIAGAVAGVLVLALLGFGVYREFFPTKKWLVFQQANRLVQGSLDTAAWGEWRSHNPGDALYINGHHVCGGYLWGYSAAFSPREAWEAEAVFFVDLDEGLACPLSETALAISREPIAECPPCAKEEYERLSGLPAASP